MSGAWTGRTGAWLGAAACCVALLYVGLWGFRLQAERPFAPAAASLSEYGETAGFLSFAATALVSGFRGLAADLLWLKADQYWHAGQWQRILPVYQLVTRLQPGFTLAWSLGGWQMAYNLSERAGRGDTAAAAWVQKGISFLKEGLRHNPEKADLYFDLGWTYFDKLKDYAAAIAYLEKAAHRDEASQTLRVLAHAYEKDGRPAQALAVWKKLLQRGDPAARRHAARLERTN